MGKKIHVSEASQFIRSYGWTPEMSEPGQWLEEDPLILLAGESEMDEGWMYRFDDWRRLRSTAHEQGINLQEQVDRLLAECLHMKQEIEELKDKISQLEQRQAGEIPF